MNRRQMTNAVERRLAGYISGHFHGTEVLVGKMGDARAILIPAQVFDEIARLSEEWSMLRRDEDKRSVHDRRHAGERLIEWTTC